MKRFLILSLCLSLFLFAGCASDEAAETTASTETTAETAAGPVDFTEAEYLKFLKDIPEITKITNPALNTGEEVNPEEITRLVMEAANSLGWENERFMYVYTQAMTVLSLEQLNKMEVQMAAQMDGMPEEQKKQLMDSMAQQLGGQKAELEKQVNERVSAEEQQIIRDNLGNLYTSLGIPQQ